MDVALEKRQVERAYELYAPVYDVIFNWIFAPGRHAAITHLAIQKNDTVLEVGIGTGLNLPLYPPTCRLTGIDLSQEMLDKAVERVQTLAMPNVTLKVMDATSMDFQHDSFGEIFSVRLAYDWLREGPWTGSVSYSFFTTYNNDLPSFNIIDHLGTVGITRQGSLFDLPLQVGGQYSFDYLVFDDNELVQRNSVSLYGALVEGAIHLTTAQARVEVKEYTETRPLDRTEFQDAVNWMAGFVHVMRFSEDRHNVKAGYQHDIEDARGRNSAYRGHRFLAGAQYTLPWWDIRLGYDFSLHYRDYLDRHSSLPADRPGSKERSDHEFLHIARIDLPLPRDLTLSLDYQGTINDSNISAFDYRRNVYTLSLSWQY